MSISSTTCRIHETISDAQSGSQETKLKALQTLVSITKVSPQIRKVVAQSRGAISTFLSLSKSSSLTMQALSLSVLFNLSLNPDNKVTLADINTIQLLNSIIISPSTSPESTKLASSFICSLAMLNKNKAKFGVAGTIESLVKALSGSRGAADHHLITTLTEVVNFHGNCTLAVVAGAVSILMHIVESAEGEDLAGASLAAVGLLARFEEVLTAVRSEQEMVKKMVGVLRGRCMFSKEGALEILVRLFEDSEVCVEEALRLSDFLSVLGDVSVRGSVRAREKAAFAHEQNDGCSFRVLMEMLKILCCFSYFIK